MMNAMGNLDQFVQNGIGLGDQQDYDRIGDVQRDVQSLLAGQSRFERALEGIAADQRRLLERLTKAPVPAALAMADGGIDVLASTGPGVGQSQSTSQLTPPLEDQLLAVLPERARASLHESGDELRRGFSMIVSSLHPTWPKCVNIRTGFSTKTDEDPLGQCMVSKRSLSEDQKEDAVTNFDALLASKGSQYVLTPTSFYRVSFDIFSLAILAYDLISMPYFLAWEVPLFKPGAYVTLMFWVCDIFLNFRTGYYANGVLVTNGRWIAFHYLRTLFLLDAILVVIDVVTLTLTFLWEVESAGATDSMKAVRVAKVSRVFRIVLIMRMAHAGEAFERLCDLYPELRSSGLVIGVFKNLVIILWLNHVIACIWYALGRAAYTDTGVCWLDAPISQIQSTSDAEIDTYRDASFWYQYWTSMHFSLTQMTPGSMQVYPESSAERIMNIVCLFFGVVVFSCLVSSVTANIMHFRLALREQQKMVGTLDRFLRNSMVSPALIVTVVREVRGRLRERKQLTAKDVPALKLLSKSNTEQLLCELYRPPLFRMPFLRVCAEMDYIAMRKLASEACDSVSYLPGEVLFESGTDAMAAYFLQSGALRYTQEPWTSNVEKETRKMVDAGRWLAEPALWCDWCHVGTTEASMASEGMALYAQKFVEVLAGSLLVGEFARAYAKIFHARLASARPPRAHWPSDLAVENTGYDEIIASAPDHVQLATGLATIEILQAQRMFWNWTRSTKPLQISLLKDEVQHKKSVLVVNETGTVQRVAVVVAIRLEGPEDKIFARVGKYQDGSFKAGCVLPGTKPKAGEGPMDTLQRVLVQDLPFLKEAIEVHHLETVVEWKYSDKTALKTKYIRHVHTARLAYEMPQLPLAKLAAQVPGPPCGCQPSSTSRRRPSAIQSQISIRPRDVYAVAGNDSVLIYAWIRDQELKDFDSPGGKKALDDCLACLDEAHLRSLIGRSASDVGTSDVGDTEVPDEDKVRPRGRTLTL